MHLQVATIMDNTMTDGPGGPRTSVYFQGCSLGCAGCQSPGLWSFAGGTRMTPEDLAQALRERGRPVTLIGGEPLQQDWVALADLVERLVSGGLSVMLYTGLRWEDELLPHLERGAGSGNALRALLSLVDVLVDGRFERRQDDAFVQWRGSRNQRPLDLAAMRAEATGTSPWWGGALVMQDWDRPRLTIGPDGRMLGAAGLIRAIEQGGGGDSAATRRCGQLPK